MVPARSKRGFSRVSGLFVRGALITAAAGLLGACGEEQAPPMDPMARAAVAERIKPIGEVNVASAAAPGAAPAASPAPAAPAPAPAAPAAPATARSGAEVFQTTCFACHGTGAAGAPKVGDKAAWGPRAAQGMETLLHSAMNGKNAMPPRGGNPSVTDAELKAAIAHMLKETGLEAGAGTPPAPAAPPAAAAAPAPGGVDLARGKEVYTMVCFPCHGTGAAGAPKMGDKAAWAPRIAQGMDTLLTHALSGFKAMPPKGGRTDLGDGDVASAISYMVGQSQ